MKTRRYVCGTFCFFLMLLLCACRQESKDITDYLGPERKETTGLRRNETANLLRAENTNAELLYDGVYPEHEPYGKGIGAMPGRVVWDYEPVNLSDF